MNISSTGGQYTCGQYAVTRGCTGRQEPAATGTVATTVDPAAPSAAAASAVTGPAAGSQPRHHGHHWHHHHHGHHGQVQDARRQGGWNAVQGRYQDANGPHAMAAKTLDDAVDTLTQQVTSTLAELPAGASDTQTRQVADLQSTFVESIRDVAARFRVHDLGMKGAQAGLQQAFDTLTAGISATFPNQAASIDAPATPGGESVPAGTSPAPDAPVVAASAGDVPVPAAESGNAGRRRRRNVTVAGAARGFCRGPGIPALRPGAECRPPPARAVRERPGVAQEIRRLLSGSLCCGYAGNGSFRARQRGRGRPGGIKKSGRARWLARTHAPGAPRPVPA